MSIDLPKRDTLTEPLYLSLAAALEQDIVTGRIERGQRLPTHRAIAARLGLSIHTVSKAFDRLKQQNLVDATVGRGTFVVDPEIGSGLPYAARRPEGHVLDLAISRPLFDHRHDRLMRQALRDHASMADPSVFLASRPNLGQLGHREAGVAWLERCGVTTTPDKVVVTNGIAHGVLLALSAATRPGDVVLADRITHHTVISLCAFLGLRLVGIESDEDGLLPDALAAACAQDDARALVILPTLAGPIPGVMSKERRGRIADVVRGTGLTIIENDALAPLASKAPAPFAALLPDSTIHLTTFTKSAMPGLRTGYLVTPLKLKPAIQARMIAFSWTATPLMADIAAAWVRDGTAADLAEWQRLALGTRHKMLAEAFAGLQWSGDAPALHVWLDLPEPWKDTDFQAEARHLDIDVAPSGSFLVPGTDRVSAVRISLGSVRDDADFAAAAKLLGELAKSRR